MIDVVEALVRNLIGGEEGVKMRRRVGKIKETAKRAVKEGGSSYKNLEKLIRQITPQQMVEADLDGSPDG